MTRSQDQQLFWSYSCCGLYHGAGYTLIYFSKSDIFVAVRVIRHAGYRPENTVTKNFNQITLTLIPT